jgi:hypothetical protein
LPEQGRGRLIEELHERGLLGFKFTPLGKVAPQVDFVNRSMPGLRILTARYAGVRREALPSMAAHQGGDYLYLCLTLAGTSVVTRCARETVLSDGDAVLMTGWGATVDPCFALPRQHRGFDFVVLRSFSQSHLRISPRAKSQADGLAVAKSGPTPGNLDREKNIRKVDLSTKGRELE